MPEIAAEKAAKELRAALEARDGLRVEIREARGVLKDLRGEIKEARAVKAELRKAIPSLVENEVQAEVEGQIERMGEQIREVTERAVKKVTNEFERLANILMGRERHGIASEKIPLEDLVRLSRAADAARSGIPVTFTSPGPGGPGRGSP